MQAQELETSLISSSPFTIKYFIFPGILCIKELCLCQATKYLESHNRASRADKAVHVAEEALGDERQATSLLWALFLQSTRLAQGTILAPEILMAPRSSVQEQNQILLVYSTNLLPHFETDLR